MSSSRAWAFEQMEEEEAEEWKQRLEIYRKDLIADLHSRDHNQLVDLRGVANRLWNNTENIPMTAKQRYELDRIIEILTEFL